MRKLFLLFFLGFGTVAFAQTRITGKVVDAKDNTPIIGVSVFVQGTTTGASTDVNGTFTITPPQSKKDNVSLKFSYIGYDDAVVQVGSKTEINVALRESALGIDEIVVTGFKDAKKETFTGASVKVKADDLGTAGVTDVSRMLEGKVAGVFVQNVSNTFGAAPKIRIRGVTSLSGENKPLWVVDGVVLEDVVSISNDQLSSGDPTTLLGSSVAGINASDIESFDILKDAAATALYGARAMNGVVVITTKKGRQGAPVINYSGNFTIRTKPLYSNYDIMNSADQMSVTSELERKGLLNQDILNASNSGVYGLMWKAITSYDPETGFGLANTREAKKAFLMKYAQANTDWFDLLFTHNLLQEHSLSISSGSEKSRTYASVGFLRDGGWTIADEVSRYTLNFRNDFDVSRKISLGFQAVASLRQQTAPGSYARSVDPVSGEWSRDFDINPFSYALNTSRALRAYDDNGDREYVTMNYAPFNILTELENNKIELNVMDAKLQGEFNYKIVSGLKFNFTGALRYVKSDQVHKITENSNVAGAYRADYNSTIRQRNPYLWTNPEDLNAEPISVMKVGGFYNTTNYTMLNYDMRASMAYAKTWNGARLHELNLLGGMQVKYADRTNMTATQAGYQYGMGGVVDVDPNYFRMMADRQLDLYTAYDYRDRFVAFYANADYAFDRKYSLSATVRYDGSNSLGTGSNSRWLPTWNFGAKWNISNEPFMDDVSWIDMLSLRASYGLTASMPPASNASAVFYNTQAFRPGYTENQIAIGNLANTELTWEKSYQFNAGLDMTLLGGRMNLAVDYFQRNSFDLIAPIKVSGIGGEMWKFANYADLDASGVDITLGGTMIKTKDWSWDANFTFGYSTNEIKNAKNAPAVYGLVRSEGGNINGYPVNSLFSIPFVGFDRQGIPLFRRADGTIGQDVYMQGTDTGFLKYEGSVDPKYTGGLTSTLRWKTLSLNVFFTYQAGNMIRLAPTFRSSYDDIKAITTEVAGRFVMPGDDDSPSIVDKIALSSLSGYPFVNYNYSTARVAKGDFIRLKTLSVNYDLPSTWVSKSQFFRTASLRFTAKDLWLIYSDKRLNGQDPEFYNNGGVATPTSTQFVISLNLGF